MNYWAIQSKKTSLWFCGFDGLEALFSSNAMILDQTELYPTLDDLQRKEPSLHYSVYRVKPVRVIETELQA